MDEYYSLWQTSGSTAGYYYVHETRPRRLIRARWLNAQYSRMVGRYYRDQIDMLEKRLAAYRFPGVN